MRYTNSNPSIITIRVTLTLAALLFTSTMTAQSTPSKEAIDRAKATPVLVELFTSEGCSSCPPADALLTSLSKLPNIITISEHVDYWNHLGWIDPYSNRQFSDRQKVYGDKFNLKGVYTPQAVIDGVKETNGSSRNDVLKALDKARAKPKVPLQIKAETANGRLSVSVSAKHPSVSTIDPIESNSIYLVLVENNLTSRISRGENQGRSMNHSSVARLMQSTMSLRPAQAVSHQFNVNLDKNWKLENLKAVVFVQGDKTGSIKALASTKLK